jgi:Putative Zn-dependent protease, contains TPR repeats
MSEENQVENNGGVEELLSELDPRFKKQFETAKSSVEKGNPGYAVGVCQNILAKHPACVEVRDLLHVAQRKLAGKPNPVANITASFSAIGFSIKASKLSKAGDITGLLDEGEKALKANPYNTGVLGAMAKACEAANYWSTAALCYKGIYEAKPKDIKNLMNLGNAYVKSLRSDEAMAVGEAILRMEPANGDAQNLMRVASVVKTMQKDKWEKEGDFKDKIKSSDEVQEREAATRLANDADTLTHIIDRVKGQIEADPENINLYREIAQHLRTLKRFAEALTYINKARELPMGKADTTLEKLESDLRLADMDTKLADLKAKLEANPDDAVVVKEYADAKATLHTFRLENAKTMVERYPNDFNYRYIYGNLLFEDGKMDEAIGQFQLSQRNPKVRLQSLLGLGRAFLSGKKFDLAVDQLETAKKESLIMNDSKKEIIYELARAYELMGQGEKAFIEYKEIYSSDIGYKDVSSKINAYYEKKNS